MNVATAHLIYGYLAVGKTTFARKLEHELGAVRFSADEWYMRLFVREGTTHELDQGKFDRLLALLNEMWPTILERGIDVVLDFGFWNRALRDQARNLTHAVGGSVRLYEITCREDVAQQRLLTRNQNSIGHFQLDLLAFEALNKLQPLDVDEKHETIDTTNKPDGSALDLEWLRNATPLQKSLVAKRPRAYGHFI